jgi:hypothetical protein
MSRLNDRPGSATTQTPPKLLKTRTFQQRITQPPLGQMLRNLKFEKTLC